MTVVVINGTSQLDAALLSFFSEKDITTYHILHSEDNVSLLKGIDKIDILINQAILSTHDLIRDVYLVAEDPLYERLNLILKDAQTLSQQVAPEGRIITLLSSVSNSSRNYAKRKSLFEAFIEISAFNLANKGILPWRLKVDYSHAAYLVSFFLKKFIILNSLNCILVR